MSDGQKSGHILNKSFKRKRLQQT